MTSMLVMCCDATGQCPRLSSTVLIWQASRWTSKVVAMHHRSKRWSLLQLTQTYRGTGCTLREHVVYNYVSSEQQKP